MKLTTRDFKRSVVSLANGTDIQPLLRTSHLAGIQVWATCGCGPEDFLRSLEQKLAQAEERWPGALELVGVEPLDPRDIQAGPVMPPPGGFPADQEPGFRKVSEMMAREGPWGRVLHLTRQVGFGIARRIRVSVIAGEGLATYSALSFGGRHAPRALVTVQQGNFENPSGLLNHALRAWDRGGHGRRGPRWWIRGKWWGDAPGWGNDDPEEGAWTPWSTLVNSYSNWDARLAAEEILLEPPIGTISHVKAWSRWDDPVLSLPDVTILSVDGGRKLTLRRCGLDDEAVAAADLVVTSESIASGLDQRDQVVMWHELTGGPHPSLAQALDAMGRDERLRGARRVVMTLVGFEDEGAMLPRWLAVEGRPEELEVRFVDPLALVDLRGPVGMEPPAARGGSGAGREARRSARPSVSREPWLTSSRLPRAAYYPGAYFDLSLVTRFSHLIDQFVLVDHLKQFGNPAMTPSEVVDRLQAEVAAIPGLEVTGHEVRHLRWPSCRFVVKLDLVRRIGDVCRRLELYWVLGEAGVVFDKIWAGAGGAPEIMVEIQPTHGFERLFPDRFAATGVFPKVWVLGGCAFRHVPASRYAPAGIRPRLVQRYLNEASLAAFSSDPSWTSLEGVVQLKGPDRVATLRRQKLTGEVIAREHFGAVVATGRVLDQLSRTGLPPHVETYSAGAEFRSLLSEVDFVGEFLGTDVRVAAVPVGREDEGGVLLQQWVESRGGAPSLTLFHKHELDFAELRGWRS
ncbi:MAG: hypothetical protein GY898_03110 [Proteobacteria bacterium]|nr:hypothetical protein [Pseudomonadota bacterium]